MDCHCETVTVSPARNDNFTITEKGNYGKDHWLVGKGFEENALAQKTSPEAYVLNEISDSVPVVIINKDETVACANTVALTKMNVEHKKGIVDKNSIKDLKNAIK